MNGRALRTACALTLLVLLGGAVTAVSVADNPHGTPPGQVGKSDNGNGNGKDSPAASQSSQASTDASSNAATPTAPPPSDKYAGCSGSTSTDGTGVKPSNSTKHFTCATAGSNQTKEYGNGKTAGQIAMSRGAPASTEIYGPGNSQPHKVATCDKNGKVHYKDVHAVKSYSSSGCASTGTPTQTSNTAATSNPSSTTNNTSVTTNNTSVTNNSSSTTNHTATQGVLGATKTLHRAAAKHHAAVKVAAKPVRSSAKPAAKPISGVLAATSPARSTLPFTGVALWLPALLGLACLGLGLGLRRHGRSET